MADAEYLPQNEEERKKALMPEQYRVIREKGTEALFSGKLGPVGADGLYHCAACGNPLFAADAKMEHVSSKSDLKKERQEKTAAVLSMFFLVIATIAYSFYEVGNMLFCPYMYKYYYIYTDALGYFGDSSCDTAKSLGANLSILFLVIAVVVALSIVLRRENLRKLFKRFITIFAPIGIIILAYGWLSSFCLMMSCSDGWTPAIRFDVFIILLAIFTLAWNILLPDKYKMLGILLVFITPFILFKLFSALYSIEQRPILSAIYAIEDKNVEMCPTVMKDLEQSCVQQVAVGLRDMQICENLGGSQRVFCVNAVYEQMALDRVDVSLCRGISDPDWDKNCEDRLSYKKL